MIQQGQHSQPEKGNGQASATHRSVDKAVNGSMVQDVEDMKRLGNDMETVLTNTELKEEGWISDPIQDE
jgi:hypothetical protein